MKKAFTLIELLVVIAIIAILAAILFPVFAQAKAAAKGTVALSNAKENGLALIMYSGDFDDVAVIGSAWEGNGLFDFGGGSSYNANDGLDVSPWTWLSAPYTKSYALLEDPLAMANPTNAANNTEIMDLLNPQFGLNEDGLSPDLPDSTFTYFTQQPKSLTSLHSSAGFVMLASKTSFGAVVNTPYWGGGIGYAGFYGYEPSSGALTPGKDNGPITNGVVWDPNCFSGAAICLAGWGALDQYDSYMTQQFPTGQAGIVEGILTGCVSRRRDDLMTLVFVDGHAKAVKPGAAAIGTNYSDTTPESQLVVSDKNAYMWSGPLIRSSLAAVFLASVIVGCGSSGPATKPITSTAPPSSGKVEAGQTHMAAVNPNIAGVYGSKLK